MPPRRMWRPGLVVRIPLPDGTGAYARLRREPLIAVYDARSADPLGLPDVLGRPILFSVWVMRRCLGLWHAVGEVPLEPSLASSVSFVKRDRLTGRVATYTDGEERQATPRELHEPEVAAVWEPEHVIDRILDHYAGRPNRWAESLRRTLVTPRSD